MHEPFEINKRLVEELSRFGDTPKEIGTRLNIDRDAVRKWISTYTNPTAYYLAVLCEAGCDVIYILTGERSNHARP